MNRQFPLPAVTSPIAPDLRRFLDRVKESFDDPDGLVTRKDLVDTGVFRNTTGAVLEFLEPGEEIAYFTPPAALNLAAEGSMTAIILTWDGVNYNTGYAYTEVWRASVDNLGVAVLVGTATAGIYADAVGSDAAHYYWVRMVNVLNDKGPFNAIAGVAGATAPDVPYLLSQLTTSITNGQLASTLAASINSTFHQNDAPTAKADGTTLVAGDVWIDANGNDAVSIYNGSSWVSANVATQAYVGTEITQQVGYCERTVTSSGAKNVATTYTTKATCEAASVSGESFAWKDDTALAGEVKTVTTTADGNTATVQVHTDSIDGINAKHTVKIDNNGYVTGYGLISTANNGTPTSEFMVVADQFSIAPVNTSNTATDGSPFFHRTSSTIINGVTIPAGTYMKGAFIHDATITNAKIGALAVDAAKIANATIVNAKIADGTIETAKIKDANITTAKITDAAITTAKVNDAAITNAKIGNTIQSAAYSAGTAGWKIDKTGAMEMNNATFRGTLDVTSAASGSRLVIDGDTIEVYDGSTLRVKLGNLA